MSENIETTKESQPLEIELDRMVRHMQPSPRFIGQLREQLDHYYDHKKRYQHSVLWIVFSIVVIVTSIIYLFWHNAEE